MKHTIKAPTTVRELGDLAEQLDMDLTGVMDLLEDALGKNWWSGDHEDFTVEFFKPAAATPPAGYQLAEGCTDRWVGAEVEAGELTVIPVWNRIDQHLIELWTAKGTNDASLVDLAPADAFDLAADLIATAKAIGNAA